MDIKEDGFQTKSYSKDVECKICGCIFTAKEEDMHYALQFHPFMETSSVCRVYCPKCHKSSGLSIPWVVESRVEKNAKNFRCGFWSCKHDLGLHKAKCEIKFYGIGSFGFTTKKYSIYCDSCDEKYNFGMFELPQAFKDEIERLQSKKMIDSMTKIY